MPGVPAGPALQRDQWSPALGCRLAGPAAGPAAFGTGSQPATGLRRRAGAGLHPGLERVTAQQCTIN